MNIYDNEGTLQEMTISSADEEEQEAAQWALDEIERLRTVVSHPIIQACIGMNALQFPELLEANR